MMNLWVFLFIATFLIVLCESFMVNSFKSFTNDNIRLSKVLMASSSKEYNSKSHSSSESGSGNGNQITPPRNLKKARGGTNSEITLGGLLGQLDELNALSDRNLLVNHGGNSNNNLNRDTTALNLAYKRCEYVTKTFSKTFYMGTSLMRDDAREHVWAIYAWCRRTDDIVDSPRALLNKDILQEDLAIWTNRLDSIWADEPSDIFDLAMADTVKTYPTLSVQPFRDMIDGMIMDVPGLGKDRYATFDDLYVYCYRVAGTVGLMTLPILGTAPGVTEEEAAKPAVALGIALQLTNILRDVGEDLERGRIYLPQDEIKQFGLTEEDLFECKVTPKWVDFIKFQIARARDYYKEAAKGIPMLAPDARFAVQASLDLYSKILDKIEENNYDNFNKRAYTTKFEKLGILPGSYMASKK